MHMPIYEHLFSHSGLVYMRDGLIFGEGRIEILNDIERIVIPICADEDWNMTAANIVCRQMGFEEAYGGKNNYS